MLSTKRPGGHHLSEFIITFLVLLIFIGFYISITSSPNSIIFKEISSGQEFDISKDVVLWIEYRVVEDISYKEFALKNAHRFFNLVDGDDLSIEDIEVIEIEVTLANIGDKPLIRVTNYECINSIYRFGEIPENLSNNELAEFFHRKIYLPIEHLNLEVKEGRIYNAGIFCTDDIKMVEFNPDEEIVNKYVFIVVKPFEARFSVEVEIIPFNEEMGLLEEYKRVFKEEIVVSLN